MFLLYGKKAAMPLERGLKIVEREDKGMSSNNYNLEHKRLELVAVFARMYGVKETLEPLDFISDKDFTDMVIKWADEYLETGEGDIVEFFESRFR